jgi:hypothetical protein
MIHTQSMVLSNLFLLVAWVFPFVIEYASEGFTLNI